MRFTAVERWIQSEDTTIKIAQVVQDSVQETKSSFQSLVFKGGKVNKL